MPENTPDYEAEFLKKLQENRLLVHKQLANREPGMMKKIDTYIRRSGYSYDQVVAKIEDDEMFAFTFAVDPARQNLYEKLASKHIEDIEGISNYKNLPNGGPNSLYVIRGSIVDGANKGGITDIKSVDFYWECGNNRFYAFHKYIRESGGSQESQYDEIERFLKNANDSTDANAHFIAITDGEFFDLKSKNNQMTKLEFLQQTANNERGVYVVRIEELYDLLKEICDIP